jgi:hypothetical protein
LSASSTVISFFSLQNPYRGKSPSRFAEFGCGVPAEAMAMSTEPSKSFGKREQPGCARNVTNV